ncbi:peptidoglycan-binding domain-containing protein [Cystobacter fuscus]
MAKPEDVTVRWQLTAIAGDLFDQDKTQAALVRLHNLGFHLPKPDPNAPETQASVRAFQRKYGLTPTGALADVQQRLLDEHDKP